MKVTLFSLLLVSGAALFACVGPESTAPRVTRDPSLVLSVPESFATSSTHAQSRAVQPRRVAGTFNVGDRVFVIFDEKRMPAVVVEQLGAVDYRVRFDGYGTEYDEVANASRLEPRL